MSDNYGNNNYHDATRLLKQIANNELDEQLLEIAVDEYKNRIIVETGI